MTEAVPLLRAEPHRWGSGMVHQINLERDQTLCGKSPASCPGTKFYGPAEKITCKVCRRSIEAKERSEQLCREWEERQREREEINRQWWQHYNAYLRTETWRGKRALVLERANGRCEGCGARRATQVHHRCYPQGLLPGSPEWITQEKLFDLIAICDGCHEDVHPRR